MITGRISNNTSFWKWTWLHSLAFPRQLNQLGWNQQKEQRFCSAYWKWEPCAWNMKSHLVPEENSTPKTVTAGTVKLGCLKKGSGQEVSIPNLLAWGTARCQKDDKGLCPTCSAKEHCGVRLAVGEHCGMLTQTRGKASQRAELLTSQSNSSAQDTHLGMRTLICQTGQAYIRALGGCLVVSDVPAGFQSPPWPCLLRHEHAHNCSSQLQVPTHTKTFPTLCLVFKMRLFFSWVTATQLVTRAPQGTLAGQRGQPMVWDLFSWKLL